MNTLFILLYSLLFYLIAFNVITLSSHQGAARAACLLSQLYIQGGLPVSRVVDIIEPVILVFSLAALAWCLSMDQERKALSSAESLLCNSQSGTRFDYHYYIHANLIDVPINPLFTARLKPSASEMCRLFYGPSGATQSMALDERLTLFNKAIDRFFGVILGVEKSKYVDSLDDSNLVNSATYASYLRLNNDLFLESYLGENLGTNALLKKSLCNLWYLSPRRAELCIISSASSCNVSLGYALSQLDIVIRFTLSLLLRHAL